MKLLVNVMLFYVTTFFRFTVCGNKDSNLLNFMSLNPILHYVSIGKIINKLGIIGRMLFDDS